MQTRNFLLGLIQLVTSIVEGLLGLRIILKFLSANPQAPFVRWIFETTEPLLNPFEGAFPTPVLTTGVVFEFSAIFALIVYAFIGFLAAEVVELLTVHTKKRRKSKKG